MTLEAASTPATLEPQAGPAGEASAESVESNLFLDALPDIGDIDISESALRGSSDPEPKAESKAEPAPENPPEVEPASSASSGEGEEAGKGEPEAEGEEGKKHPKGYVPVAAIHEARGEISSLKEALAETRAQLTKVLSQPAQPAKAEGLTAEASTPAEEFKVLSDQEFLELVEDDPPAAILYQNKLIAYKESKAAEQLAQTAEQQRIDVAYTRMTKAIPDLFTEGSSARQELATFASELGFGQDLYFLTDPRTKVIPAGGGKPVLLGEGAASIVEMLANARTKLGQKTDTATIRAEVEKEIREQVQAELLAKFKKESSGFQSLASVPGTETPATNQGNRELTPAEFAKLSPEEQERYLTGS